MPKIPGNVTGWKNDKKQDCFDMDMMESHLFQEILQIHTGRQTTVFRAIRLPDKRPVIIKQGAFDLLMHEYQVLEKLDHQNIVKPVDIQGNNNTASLVIEDIGGDSLAHLIKKGPVPIDTVLETACKIASALSYLHEKQCIYQNLIPAHIILNPQTRMVNLVDFSCLVKKNTSGMHEEKIREKMPAHNYIAPEQTGRIKLQVDHRSDLYSLGVIMYEMMTGTFPYQSAEPSTLIHGILAIRPEAPATVSKGIPAALSDLVMRLLEKIPENRYQHTADLIQDLETSIRYLEKGQIARLKIGTAGSIEKPQIPEKLYGRDSQLDFLSSIIRKIRKGHREVVLVAGPSGIGKTFLIREAARMGCFDREYFIEGKFDPANRGIPYSAVRMAFKQLIERILLGSEAEFENWKNALKKALGHNAGLITEIFPEFEMIIGPQPLPEPLNPVEQRNRFIYVFTKFIHVFIHKSRSIVLFIDDLQWADPASLEILRILLEQRALRNFLFIGAYRDTETGPDHHWIRLVAYLKKEGIPVQELVLSSLKKEDICRILSETLDISKKENNRLGEIFDIKTGGNPFFIHQFLESISRKKWIQFDRGRNRWHCDLSGIIDARISGGFAEILLEKIKILPAKTLEILKSAALFGARVELEMLSAGTVVPIQTLVDNLQPASDIGILSFTGFRGDHSKSAIAFSHDTIFSAVSSLIDAKERVSRHLFFGKNLMDVFLKEQKELWLFSVADQINGGLSGMTTDREKTEYIKLNLKAGEKAKISSAYASAQGYFASARSLLDKLDISGWESMPEVCLRLYERSVETAFLLGQYDEMEALFQTVDHQVPEEHAKVGLYEFKTSALHAMGRFDEAIDFALEYTGRMGITLPRHPGIRHIIWGLIRTKIRLKKRSIQDLFLLPKMTDPQILAAMRVLACATLTAFYSRPNLLPIIVFESIRASMKYGNTDGSVFGYAGYGMIQCGVLQDLKSGYAFGKIALQLNRDMKLNHMKARIYSTVYGFVTHWNDHLKESLEPLKEALQSGLENGDHQFASMCARRYCSTLFCLGRNLKTVDREMAKQLKLLKGLRQDVAYNAMKIAATAVSNLLVIEGPSNIRTASLDNSDEKSGDRFALFLKNFLSAMQCSLFGKNLEAIHFLDRAGKYHEAARGACEYALYVFFDTLVRQDLVRQDRLKSVSGLKALKLNRKIKANMKQIRQWAALSPGNFAQKYELVMAGNAVCLGNGKEAELHFQRAVKTAGENEYLNDLALAQERYAEFLLNSGRIKEAGEYLLQSFSSYQEWGALAKTSIMLRQYPELLKKEALPEKKAALPAGKMENGNSQQWNEHFLSKDAVDMHAILQASRLIAREIGIRPLLRRLIHLIIENSGAQKAWLLLFSDRRLKIEAFCDVKEKLTQILPSTDLYNDETDLPASLIQYVSRSGRSVILDHAGKSEWVLKDMYIREFKPLSVLATPIINKNECIGVIYLENNLTEGVFTKERLKILDLLIRQAAISIENSRLYEKLDQEVEQKSKAVDEILAKQKLIENMSAQLAAVEERERRAIADDLHDSVIQTLALSILKLKQLKNEKEKNLLSGLSDIRTLLEQAVNETRSLTFQLSPRILYDLGLEAALDWLAEDMEKRFGLTVEVNCLNDKLPFLEESVNITLFRGARELLINIFKHAQADRAEMTVGLENNELFLVIEDNGRGFGQDIKKRTDFYGFGLYRIDERIKALSGKFTIDSTHGKGSIVEMRVPFKNREQADDF